MARAFTLIELMVSIAVLIVIAALVLPSIDSLSESSRFRSACDQLSTVASVCRAEAKRTGKPVAVVATMNEDGRQTIVSVPLGDVAQLEEDTTIEVDSRVLMVMPAGVSIRAKDSRAAERSSDPVTVAVDEQDQETTQSLIIYWADGGATASTPMVVTGPGGRTAGAKVNSWTGALSISDDPEPEVAAAGTEDDGEEPGEVAEVPGVEGPLSTGGPRLHFEEFQMDP